MNEQLIPIKLVIVGDGSVGKTCIMIRYAQKSFPQQYIPTVFDNRSKSVNVQNLKINLSLWDTAGQEVYSKLRSIAYPQTDIFLIAFSVVDQASFINARKKWFPEVNTDVPTASIIFVGNKIDVRQSQAHIQDLKNKPIEKQHAKKVIEQNFKCKYMQCSALTEEGLDNVFNEAVRQVLIKRGLLSRKASIYSIPKDKSQKQYSQTDCYSKCDLL